MIGGEERRRVEETRMQSSCLVKEEKMRVEGIRIQSKFLEL